MATFGIGEGPRGGSHDTVARRERRRRSAVRDFLLTSLEALDGARYVQQNARERLSCAPGTPNATVHDSKPVPSAGEPWDESAQRRDCDVCGRLDALKDRLCRYCYAECEWQS